MPRDERGSCIQLVRKTRFNSLFRTDEDNPSLSNIGEGFNNSWNFLPVPTPLATINKITAVWASQGFWGYITGTQTQILKILLRT